MKPLLLNLILSWLALGAFAAPSLAKNKVSPEVIEVINSSYCAIGFGKLGQRPITQMRQQVIDIFRQDLEKQFDTSSTKRVFLLNGMQKTEITPNRPGSRAAYESYMNDYYVREGHILIPKGEVGKILTLLSFVHEFDHMLWDIQTELAPAFVRLAQKFSLVSKNLRKEARAAGREYDVMRSILTKVKGKEVLADLLIEENSIEPYLRPLVKEFLVGMRITKNGFEPSVKYHQMLKSLEAGNPDIEKRIMSNSMEKLLDSIGDDWSQDVAAVHGMSKRDFIHWRLETYLDEESRFQRTLNFANQNRITHALYGLLIAGGLVGIFDKMNNNPATTNPTK